MDIYPEAYNMISKQFTQSNLRNISQNRELIIGILRPRIRTHDTGGENWSDILEKGLFTLAFGAPYLYNSMIFNWGKIHHLMF